MVDIEVRADQATINPGGSGQIRLEASGILAKDLLEVIDIDDAVDYYGTDTVLDHIGIEEVKKHFGLTEADNGI